MKRDGGDRTRERGLRTPREGDVDCPSCKHTQKGQKNKDKEKKKTKRQNLSVKVTSEELKPV